MKLAVEWELIPYSVATGIKAPKAAPGRVRYLRPTELKVLIDSAQDWLKPIIALAVLTGMRRGEILGLRWLDVDLAAGGFCSRRPRMATAGLFTSIKPSGWCSGLYQPVSRPRRFSPTLAIG